MHKALPGSCQVGRTRSMPAKVPTRNQQYLIASIKF